MTKNPLINACAATIYISAVSFLMFYGPQLIGPMEDAVIMPITMLSLLVLSVSFMAYVFGFQPIQLFLEGQKKEAANLFIKTLGFFACIVIVLFAILFFVSRRV